ncbi:MAG: hypothetical protein RR909_02405 [Bacilli bacterium]
MYTIIISIFTVLFMIALIGFSIFAKFHFKKHNSCSSSCSCCSQEKKCKSSSLLVDEYKKTYRKS